MRLLIVVLPILVIGTALGQTCYDKATWSSGSGNILLNGKPFVLKGINWMGFETTTRAPHGLWGDVSLASLLDFLKNNAFNAIRMPFALDTIRDNPTVASSSVNCGSNPTLCNKPVLTIMSQFIDECAKRGIVVLLDNHLFTSTSSGYNITELWYSNEYQEAKVLELLKKVLTTVGKKWNVIGLDLKNEPHGAATWGYGQSTTDWNQFAERAIKALASSFDGLFFVEGVEQKAAGQSNEAHFWGGNLEGVRSKPINAGDANLNKRVVYAPHVYGPEEYDQAYFKVSTFPNNMPDIWSRHIGFAEKQTGLPVVVGEWGAKLESGSRGQKWADALSSFLQKNCLSDNFYWSLNPPLQAGVTGYGIMNGDWKTGIASKLELLRKTQPNPTKLSLSGSKFCVQSAGSYPNSVCNGSG